MQLRFPRPLGGWRRFVGEVGTIVLGVVIALAAGQAVDTWQWRQQVKSTNEVFNDELTFAAVMAYQRLAVHKCNAMRLREIADRLDTSGSHWHGMPDRSDTYDFNSDLGAMTYRAPQSWSPTEGWNSALADGTLNHIPAARRLALAKAYTWIRQFKADAEIEAATQPKLDVLAKDRVLSTETKLRLMQVTSDLDRLEITLNDDASQVLLWARQAQPDFWPDKAREKIAETVEIQRGRGSCVEAPKI